MYRRDMCSIAEHNIVLVTKKRGFFYLYIGEILLLKKTKLNIVFVCSDDVFLVLKRFENNNFFYHHRDKTSNLYVTFR